MHCFESVSFIIEFRKPVSGAMNYAEYLWYREHKIEYLRQKEEKHCLCEVTKDADHGKGHASKVAEGIADEDFRRELVVLE